MYRWKSKHKGAVLLNWLFSRTETVNKCVWLQMARMEMDSNLKTFGRLFCSSVSGEISTNWFWLVFFFFQNSFDFVETFIDCKTVSFSSCFSVVLASRYRCVTRECVMYESREASLSSPTRNFHARSRSFMIRFQPKRHTLKYGLFCSLKTCSSLKTVYAWPGYFELNLANLWEK